MNNKILTIVLFLLFPIMIFAQTAAEVDVLLETDEVSAAVAAYFALGSAGLLPLGFSGAEGQAVAYDTALSNGWIKAAANDSITMQETAFLIMKAFDLKGGVIYKFFPSPRYAYREMIYHRIIQGRSYSNMKVSGIELLRIIDRTFNYSGSDGELE